MKTFWWRVYPNFGDQLTVWLLDMYGIVAEWVPAPEADLIVVGSILETIPNGWAGTVLGTGKKRAKVAPDLSRARVLAVRGKLTADSLGLNVPLGDPGLLAPDLLSGPVSKQHEVGIVPHWCDTSLELVYPDLPVIRVSDGPRAVIQQIASCDRIITSSLHAMIAADALGIPVTPIQSYRIAKEGGAYKFEDYSSALGVPFEFDVERTVDPARVSPLQDRLRALFSELSEDV